MKRITKFTMLLFLITFSSSLFAQNTVDFVFKIRYKNVTPVGTIWLTTTVDSGSFNEGQNYVVPAFTMPSGLESLQQTYDAITGAVFVLDNGAIDEDLFLEMILDGLDRTTGLYEPMFGDSLFLNLTVNVYAGGNLVDGHYYFNTDKYLWFKIPITPAFINLVVNILQFGLNDLGFAYIEPDGFEGSGITTIITADSAMFRAEHLSKFGGGRGHISTTTGIGYEKLEGVPSKYELAQNYPNPFNPSTLIKFAIPQAGEVQLKVYNVLGSEVATLISGYHEAGNYEVEFNAENLSSGIYLYTLKTNQKIITKKMMLVK